MRRLKKVVCYDYYYDVVVFMVVGGGKFDRGQDDDGETWLKVV